MNHNTGNKFIPSFIFSNIFLAIVSPYLIILIRELGYSPLWVGLLLGVFEIAGIAGPFLLGYLSDKTGNYRLSLIISGILPALVAFPLILFVHPAATAAFIFFLAFGLRSLISLIDAATTVHIGISGNYGRLRAWGTISFIFMTLFFQWTPFLKPDNVQTISMWIMLTAAICVIPTLLLPGSFLKHEKKMEAVNDKTITAAEAKKPSYIFCGFSMIFLSRFGMTAVLSYFSLFLLEEVKWDVVGLMWALAAIAEAPFMIFAGRFIRRFGSMPILALSAASVCVRLLLLAFFPVKPWIVVSVLLHSLCFGIYHPAAINFITSIFPVEQRGRGMSVYMIIGSGLPSLIGIIAGGAIIHNLGYQKLFLLYAGISGLAVIIYGILRKHIYIKN